ARGFVRVAVGVALQAGHDAGASLAARRLGIGALRTALIAATAVARIGIDVHALVRAKKGLGRTVAGALDADLRGQTGISAAAAVLHARGGVDTGAVAGRKPLGTDAFALHAELAREASATAAAAVLHAGRGVHARAVAGRESVGTDAFTVDTELVGPAGISAAAAVLDTGGSVHTRALASREPRRADAFAVDAELALEAGAIASATMCRIRIRIHAG